MRGRVAGGGNMTVVVRQGSTMVILKVCVLNVLVVLGGWSCRVLVSTIVHTPTSGLFLDLHSNLPGLPVIIELASLDVVYLMVPEGMVADAVPESFW